jgi:hypothetical protein
MILFKRCADRQHIGDRSSVSVDLFGISTRIADGYSDVCKECVNRRSRARWARHVAAGTQGELSLKYRTKNADKIKAFYTERRRTPSGFKECMFKQAKHRAKKSGLSFTIVLDDIDIPTHCPILGIELVIGATRDQVQRAPSLDRIDSSRGYDKDNIIVVSWRANKIKGDATIEELLKLAAFYQNLIKSQ